jgi:hydroxyisourate hydrolase
VKLSTHVLDTARGLPAAGILVTLLALDGEPRVLAQTTTNADGRTDAPLAADLPPGRYELAFLVGPYFASRDVATFYDVIPIRFRIEDPTRDHHVPLLLAPWGYSTYRGS